jgi:hypothetical protein
MPLRRGKQIAHRSRAVAEGQYSLISINPRQGWFSRIRLRARFAGFTGTGRREKPRDASYLQWLKGRKVWMTVEHHL